jgi:uncharacterized protein YdcH (DUF465 family)
MKVLKGIIIALVAVVVLVLGAAVIIPIVYKGKILAVVKQQMNEQLNATADFRDVDLSLFKHFPDLSVSVLDLSITGKAPFATDTLLALGSFDIAVDVFKALGGKYEIVHIGLNNPRINAIVLPDGTANWNITKPAPPAPTTAQAPAAPFAVKLKSYSVKGASIRYTDNQGKIRAIIQNLNHSGTGNFTNETFTLGTVTSMDALTVVMGNIPYLNAVITAANLDINIDNKTNKYTFNTDKIQLNGLKMSCKGSVTMPDTTNMILDIQFGTPSNDFKDILSLVPGVYSSNFKDIKTSGKLLLNGNVKGNFNKKQLPAFNVTLQIADGAFQYPALPQKVSDIQVKLAINNPDGVMDHTVVNLEKCHINLGSQPFDFRMVLKTPMTDQWIDAGAKGIINLAQMEQLVKLDAGTKMAGIVTADFAVRGSMAAAQRKEFQKLDASGSISIKDMQYVSKDYPDGVKVDNMLLTFNPKDVTLSGLKGNYSGINFTGEGNIDNMLGFYLHNEVLNGAFKFTADKINVNKLMGPPAPTPAPAAPPAKDPFLVPANVNISLLVSAGSMKYDSLLLENFVADMTIANEKASIKSMTANALDGVIKMSGSYSTQADKKHPEMAFMYGLENVDVQKTYITFNTVQKLMPAAKCIAGKVTSHFTMDGRLNPDMSPVLNSLSGKGDLLLNNCVLSNLPAADQLADKLHLSQFKSLTLKDTKITFSFKDGRVTIDPYKTKLNDIDAEIAGSHGFDNTMQYGLNLSVPRSALGSAGNDMVNNLASQAAAKGLPVNLGEKVNLAVNITGTFTNPKIETNLKNSATDAVNAVKQEIQKKVDSIKTVVKDTVKALKNQAVNAVKDEAVKQLQNPNTGDKKVDNAINQAKEGLNGLFKKKK